MTSSSVKGIGEFRRAVRIHQLAKLQHVVAQLRLRYGAAIGQPIVLEVELTLVCEILVVVADALADATQYHGAGCRQRHLQQDVGAVVRKVEAPARVDLVGAEVHTPFVDDQQKLQGIDQAGFASVVRSDQRHRRIKR